MLTGALFMLEVYDRVLPSRSVPTLIGLVILAGGLYAALGLLDLIRGRILVRIGSPPRRNAQRPRLRDDRAAAAQGRQSQRRAAAVARSRQPSDRFCRAPGRPRCSICRGCRSISIICFLFHPYIGLAALFGAIILGIITLLTETMTREPTRAATGFAMTRTALAETSRRNAEVLTAMGMTGRIAALWGDANAKYLASPAARQRRRRRLRIGIEGAADDAAVRRARGRRLSRDLSAGHRRHHHRRLDPECACAGAGRPGDRQLARLRRRPAGLEASDRPARAAAGAGDADGAAAAFPERGRGERERRAARQREGRRAGRQPCRCRPATASASSGRAAPAKARWRACWSASGGRCAAGFASTAPRSINGRRSCSAGTSAICRRTSSSWPARSRRTSAASREPQDAEAIIAAATAAGVHDLIVGLPERLRDPGRRKRHGAVGRTGATGRARARALWRSVPGRARRAELQSRRRGRRGAQPGHHERARPRRHRGGGRPSAERDCRRRPAADDDAGTRPGVRPEGRGAVAGAATRRSAAGTRAQGRAGGREPRSHEAEERRETPDNRSAATCWPDW